MNNKIRIIRKQKGLTQTELANLVGTAQSHIHNMETGERGVDIDMLIRLAKALGVKAYELLPDDEQPEELSIEEKKFLDMLRKSKETAVEQSTETKAS